MYKWENKWICAPEFLDVKPRNMFYKEDVRVFPEHPVELMNHHTLFRKTVNIESMPSRAELYISADDYYKLYVNGRFVTQGPASAYYFCYNYNIVDITEYLHQGENTLFVHVYYQGLINRAFDSADFRQGMIADMIADGTQIIDNKWKYSYAKEYISKDAIIYDTQFYDVIDNNLAKTGCERADFDDSDWEIAPVNYSDDHILVRQLTPNVVCERVYPETITECDDGLLIDFGSEITGMFSAVFYGEKGNCVDIFLGEDLENDGKTVAMRCNCDYHDRFILRDGENTFSPYEYKAFRYVKLVMPSGVRAADVSAFYRHYPFENISKPKIENELLSEIWDICKTAVVNCSQEGYLDCPNREKGQYLGDLTVTAHSHICLNGDTRLLKKALRDFANSAKICPGLMGTAPGSFMMEIADFSLLYPYQVYLYYKHSKDAEFVKELVPVIDGLLEHFGKFTAENMLPDGVFDKWNLVDWPIAARDGYDFDLSRPVAKGHHNVMCSLYCGAYKYTEMLKSDLGIEYEPKFEMLYKNFNEIFYDEKTGLYKDNPESEHYALHSNVYPMFFDMAPDGNRIASLIREKGFVCSPYIAYYILLALGKNNEFELMTELLLSKSDHSWYNMLKEGATAAFEAWGIEQKESTSLCHGWASSPIVAIREFPQILRTTV